jgi:hypothetical protein
VTFRAACFRLAGFLLVAAAVLAVASRVVERASKDAAQPLHDATAVLLVIGVMFAGFGLDS